MAVTLHFRMYLSDEGLSVDDFCMRQIEEMLAA